ncbi:hypothetical protein EC396_12890 [Lutibacter sp. HS1-25]|uniref:hypothetical protein n=1 Tax=Lutibacter sp. HS1-25 TaxID=2485000 RepID=UPI0010109EB9|nr:hypothetical protein [Lutibacter sp. HS1-25]RXP47940.1 hypothetical protein EC396_12890 [Lutibacter sp. HS1-25]
MPLKKNQTEAEALEQYRVSFENVEKQTEIATIMAEFGYDETLLTEGKTLLTKTREIYDYNKKEDDEKSAAYKNFTEIKENLAKTYGMHRKKAKVIFRKEPTILNKLALTGSLPTAYIKWLETVKKFYTVASKNKDIQDKLIRLKITIEEINETIQLISDLETARAEYLREKGESQDATKLKDKAFGEIDDWMSEFYAVAKIGLEDHPQLLESLGKFVRS